jgi:hypothetical protein
MSTVNTSNLGGPFAGYVSKPIAMRQKGGEHSTIRHVLRSAWNTGYATQNVNGYKPRIGEFRAINNAGDYLGRVQYSCGGPNPTNTQKAGLRRKIGRMWSNCDSTGVPASSCNVKYVYDSSDYIKFKKLRAHNLNYNDVAYGGGARSTEFTTLNRVRR